MSYSQGPSCLLQNSVVAGNMGEVDGINELYQGEVADVERKFQARA